MMPGRTRLELEDEHEAATTAPPPAAPTPVGAVLALQRSAGNHATQALLQRKVATDPATLGETGKVGRLKAVFGQSTYTKIREALADYHAASTPGKQYVLMKILMALIVKWTDANAAGKGQGNQERLFKLQRLAQEITVEMASFGPGGGEYLADLEEQMELNEADAEEAKDTGTPTRKNRDRGKFRYASSQVRQAMQESRDITEGKGKKEAVELVKKYGLTLADVTAIRIYTVDDFKYINPAMAENEGWLKAQIPETVGNKDADVSQEGLDQAKAEGQRHGEMTVQGLKKLPPWKGTTFRGLGLTPDELKKEYPKGKTIVQKPFLSTSLEESVADGFAKTNSVKPGKVGILMHLTLTEGRDIAALSKYGSEKEILVIAGATFHVDDVKLRPGTNVYDVYLSQTG